MVACSVATTTTTMTHTVACRPRPKLRRRRRRSGLTPKLKRLKEDNDDDFVDKVEEEHLKTRRARGHSRLMMDDSDFDCKRNYS